MASSTAPRRSARLAAKVAKTEAPLPALFPPQWTHLLEDDERILTAYEMLRDAKRGDLYSLWCEMGCPKDHTEEALDYYGLFDFDVQQRLLKAIEETILSIDPPTAAEPPSYALLCVRCAGYDPCCYPLCYPCITHVGPEVTRLWLDSGRLKGEEREKRMKELQALYP